MKNAPAVSVGAFSFLDSSALLCGVIFGPHRCFAGAHTCRVRAKLSTVPKVSLPITPRPGSYRLRVAAVLAASALALSGCQTAGPLRQGAPHDRVVPFSANVPGSVLPAGWHPWIITRAKAKTTYQLIRDEQTGQVVLRALSDRSASGLKQFLDVSPVDRPRIRWQWRAMAVIDDANPADRDFDDSPTRLLLFFDGDLSTLPARELMLMETGRMLTGQPVPFATLMYVWDNRRPVDTVIPHPSFGQLKMIVASSGSTRVGHWKQLERNYADDYARAFGTPPSRLVGIGVLTDSDNTGSRAYAYYGDIELLPAN